MMGKWIDKDTFREHMYHESFKVDNGMQKWDSGLWIRYKLFEQALRTAVTIEAEPVRLGRWVDAQDTSGHCYKRCSECGTYIEDVFFANDYDVNYCPCCGAKMDLDKVKEFVPISIPEWLNKDEEVEE